MKDELIPSPYSPQPNRKLVTKEQFEQVKKLLGVESLLIVAEEKLNDCDGVNCLGHFTFFISDGFNEHNLGGIGATLQEAAIDISTSYKKLP